MKQSQAVVKKRQQKIVEFFEEEETLTVRELSSRLGVSELTIRRDFSYLEKKGLVKRFHGGAKKANSAIADVLDYDNKHTHNLAVKRRIANTVAQYINDGDTVFINGGTTTIEIIKAIIDKNITIVTNHAIAFTFFDEHNAKLLSTGGEYNPKSKSYSGPLATALIDRMVANICILGVNGLTYSEGITTAFYSETMVNESFIKRTSGKVIVAADGSKLGKTFGFNTATIDKLDLLVSDSSADPIEIDLLRKAGVDIVLADLD